MALRDIIHKVESNSNTFNEANEEQKAALYRKLLETVVTEIGDHKIANDWQQVLHASGVNYNNVANNNKYVPAMNTNTAKGS